MLDSLERITFMGALVLYLVASSCYFYFFVGKNEKAGKFALSIIFLAFLSHTFSMAIRGIHAGHLPFTSQYEFASSFAWGVVLCFLVFVKKFHFNALGTFVSPVVFLIIGYASMQSYEIKQLMPALQSNWLGFHVSMAIVAYGSFGVAFGVAMVFLFRSRLGTGAFASSHIPPENTLDLIIYRSVALGFLFLTLCMITGAIWAQKAWGSYWNWDPKETWSLVTWIIYAMFLHLRLNRGWKGKKSAAFAVIGFLCVIFTYIGVNTLLSGLHSYA